MTTPTPRLFTETEPPEGITLRTTTRITRLRVRRARVRLALLGTTTLASVVATVNVGVSLASELTQSGASEYLTLLWTDADIVLAHSKAFLLSLSEVLPLSGITLLLAVLFVLLWTLPRVSAAARVAFTPARSLAVS